MSQTEQDVSVGGDQSNATFRIYAVVLSVGVCCSLAIVTAYQATLPIIQFNKKELRGRAILDVLPGATTSEAFRLDESTGQFQRGIVRRRGL